jgi:hypothetical protein
VKPNKDKLRETITIEFGAWLIILGIVYMLVKTVI